MGCECVCMHACVWACFKVLLFEIYHQAKRLFKQKACNICNSMIYFQEKMRNHKKRRDTVKEVENKREFKRKGIG